MRNLEQIILFGKYQVISVLGEGASGEVFLAEHLKLKTCRAIKRICKTHPLQSQFRLEAHLLKSLSHPSIPIIYDIEEDEEYIYIIEEYARGESLQKYLLYHDSISQEYIMQLGIRLCDVFAYLHSRKPHPVYYKDLKPEHIIVCGNSVKIVDFGIASYISSAGKNFQNKDETDPDSKEAFAGYGTVGYAAPEQYDGGQLSPATDLYALGRVLWQLEHHARGKSKNLKRIIQKATAEDIGKRYASAGELKQALERELKRVCPKCSGNTHLYHHIAVVGAKSGIGTTHLAVAITAYLNRKGQHCVYQSRSEADIVELLIRGDTVTEEEAGVYAGGYFEGILKGVRAERKVSMELTEYSFVMDFGSRLKDCALEEVDCIILVIGGSAWEQECSRAAVEKLRGISDLLIVCNHNRRRVCRKYARIMGRKVYCFPFDLDPFEVTKEKQKLFDEMLRMKKFFESDKVRERVEGRNAVFFPKWRK